MGSALPWGYRNEQDIAHALERAQFHDRHREVSQAKERVLWGQREPTQPYLGSEKSECFLKEVTLKLSFAGWSGF